VVLDKDINKMLVIILQISFLDKNLFERLYLLKTSSKYKK